MAAIGGSGHWPTLATACSRARHTKEPMKGEEDRFHLCVAVNGRNDGRDP
jgi:hypothetical protein